jgi:hypothetical protein
VPETGTDAKSSLRKCIGFESNSVWACAKGEIAALIVAVIETPLYSACAGMIAAADTLQQGHSKQRVFRVKHPQLTAPGSSQTSYGKFSAWREQIFELRLVYPFPDISVVLD